MTQKNQKINCFKSIFLSWMMVLILGIPSCKEDLIVETFPVTVSLVYPGDFLPKEGVKVSMRNMRTGVIFEAKTDEKGDAVFQLCAGQYTVSASEKRIDGFEYFNFNGSRAGQMIFSKFDISMPLTFSKSSAVVIKELYVGGNQTGLASPTTFANDKYVILYNNSEFTVTFHRLCIGAITNPANSNASNNDYKNGVLFYEAEGWIPAGWGMFWFQEPLIIEPGQQIVIALTNALDHTVTYPKSINFNHPDYYCLYDTGAGFTGYSAPAPNIPSSHWLKGYRWPTTSATSLSFSVSSPAFFIFDMPETVSVEKFVNDELYITWYNNTTGVANTRRKVPVEWIVDGIEVFLDNNANNQKRLTAAVDAGYVNHNSNWGFTLYRNVDQEATEAIPENEGKIVYDYNLGTVGAENITNGSTDPSGIDAEASIKKGARIIYMDTNNSNNDFHLRARASLRDL